VEPEVEVHVTGEVGLAVEELLAIETS